MDPPPDSSNSPVPLQRTLVTTEWRVINDHDSMPSPFSYDLKITKIVTIPSYLSLIIFSILTFYIVLKHYRSLVSIYLSVLFYLIAQLILLLILTLSWISDLLKANDSQSWCQMILWSQTFALMLPGYGILIITGVRCIFVTRPLNYYYYIKRAYQTAAFGISISLCALMASLPYFGLCGVQLQYILKEDEYLQLSVCSYEGENKTHCQIFYSIALILGFFLPISMVVGIYTYIYRTALAARKIHDSLTQSSGSNQSTILHKRCVAERKLIPWSILAVLGLSIATTLPWTAMIAFTVDIMEELAKGGKLKVLFDVVYSMIQILIGCSPLVYLLTTNSLRKFLIEMFKINIDCRGWFKTGPGMPNPAEAGDGHKKFAGN